MNALIVVNQGPLHPGALSALAFARAWLEAGHGILRVFFYHDGVETGRRVTLPPGDLDVGARWAELARDHGLDLVLCVGAAQRRGVRDAAGAAESDEVETLAEGFRIAGLGQWMEAALEADRVVRFGGR